MTERLVDLLALLGLIAVAVFAAWLFSVGLGVDFGVMLIGCVVAEIMGLLVGIWLAR